MAKQYSREYLNATNNRVPGRKSGVPIASSLRPRFYLPTLFAGAAAIIAAIGAPLSIYFANKNAGFDEKDQPIPARLRPEPAPAPSAHTNSLGLERHEPSVLDLEAKPVSPAAIPPESPGLGRSISL